MNMLTPDYYSKRNAAHQGFEGKNSTLSERVVVPAACFPNKNRDQGGTSSLEAQFCPELLTLLQNLDPNGKQH